MFKFNFLEKIKKSFYDAYWWFAIRYTLNASARIYKRFNGAEGLNPTVKADDMIFKMEADENVYDYLGIVNNETKQYLMGHNSLLDNKIYVYFKNILRNSRGTKMTINMKRLNVLIVITVLHELSHSEQSGYDYLKWCKTKEQSRDLMESQNFKNYSKFILDNFDEINKVVKIDKRLMKETLSDLEDELKCKDSEFVPTLKKHSHIKGFLVQSVLFSKQDDIIPLLFSLDIAKNIVFVIGDEQYNVIVNNEETEELRKLKNKVDRILNSYLEYDDSTSTLTITIKCEEK